MPHYVACIELSRHQGRDATPRDYARLHEIMSTLLFDHTLSAQRLELPAGTFIGSSFEECQDLGKKIADAVQTVWPSPRIIVGPMNACWSYGLVDAKPHSILNAQRKQA